jgi:23S rRNA pseudouridine2605 synthase
MESEGLLLLTNDGEFANKLSHPKFGVKKVYYIELQNPIKRNEMERLLKGIKLEDGYSKVDSIEADQSGHLVEVAIHSGKNRILRRLFAEVGHPIERLVRISFGTIKLGELKPGKWRYLNEIELISLQNNK